MVTTKRCLLCNKYINTKRGFILAPNYICISCANKFPYLYKNIKIDKTPVLFIYKYTEFIRNILLQIKANGDIALTKVLLEPAKTYLKSKYKHYTLLPAPSTDKSNKKRGFIHLNEICKSLNLPVVNAFLKTSNYKQSNMNKFDRVNINEAISLKTSLLNHNKRYCIVDDLLTTGETIRCCLRLLKDYGVKDIKILIIAKKEK